MVVTSALKANQNLKSPFFFRKKCAKKGQVLKTETTIEMISAQYTYDVTSTPILLFTGRHTSHGHPRCHCWKGQPKTRWV